jgi:O-antigen ligase
MVASLKHPKPYDIPFRKNRSFKKLPRPGESIIRWSFAMPTAKKLGILSDAITWHLAVRKITYILSLVLIFIIPWEDSISTANIGSLARLMGIAVAGFWLGNIVIEGRFRKPNLFHVLVLMFFLWNFVSLFWSSDIQNTIQRIKTYSQIFLLMIICWDVFQKREELMLGLQAYIFGAYVLVASTIYNYLAGNIAVQYEGRYSATGVNANDVALILILGLPIAMQLLFVARRNRKGILLQAINLIYTPLSIFSIVLTGSRTSLVAILPFTIFMVGTQHIKGVRKILIFMILLVSLLALLPFVPQSVINRLGTIGNSISEVDLGGRVNMWRKSIMVLAQHPILGVGSGAIDRTIGGAVHNTLISVTTETGFIGLVLFLFILGLVVYELIRLPRRTSALWFAIFITWVIAILSLSWEFRKVTWILLSFMIIEGSFEKQVDEREGNINFSQGSGRSFEAGVSLSQPKVI